MGDADSTPAASTISIDINRKTDPLLVKPNYAIPCASDRYEQVPGTVHGCVHSEDHEQYQAREILLYQSMVRKHPDCSPI